MKVVKPNKLSLMSCSVSESDDVDGVVWDAATTYAKDQVVRHEHVKYVSLDNGNLGKNPSTTYSGTEAKWKKVGATNPYLMLDDYMESQTIAPEGEALTFEVPFSRGDYFSLLNIEGEEAIISIVEDDETIFTQSYILRSDIPHLSLYEYYFLPVVFNKITIGDSVPMVFNGRLHVTINPAGENANAKVGHIVIGRAQYIGETKYDAEIGVTDYSKKEPDDFGYINFIERAYSRNASLSLFVKPWEANSVSSLLYEIRAKPSLFVGGNIEHGYEALTLFGWMEDWRQVYVGPNENELKLEIQGIV